MSVIIPVMSQAVYIYIYIYGHASGAPLRGGQAHLGVGWIFMFKCAVASIFVWIRKFEVLSRITIFALLE